MKLLSFDVGIKNLSYCLLDDKDNTIEDWGIINISVDPVCEHCMKGNKQCDKTAKFIIDEVKLCSSHIKLKKYKDQKSKKVKKVKNPTMKTIQMILYSYFLIHGVTNELSPIDTIEMINARNKLKAYKGPTIECEIKDKYKRTKYLGIKYCEYMILENENIKQEYRDLLEESKKKDDLADAYLQGIYWLTK
jgi:hypothetical protein